MYKIYRAANHPKGRFWMFQQEDAERYLNNQHLGGDTLYQTTIDLNTLYDISVNHKMYELLDLVLPEDWSAEFPDYTDALEEPEVIAYVKEMDKIGIIFQDNFPSGAIAIFVFDGLIGEEIQTDDPYRDISDEDLDILTYEDCDRIVDIANKLKIDSDRISWDYDYDTGAITVEITSPGMGYTAERTLEKPKG